MGILTCQSPEIVELVRALGLEHSKKITITIEPSEPVVVSAEMFVLSGDRAEGGRYKLRAGAEPGDYHPLTVLKKFHLIKVEGQK